MKRKRTSLPYSEWPELDQELWQTANSKGGFLEPDGKAAHWRDKTRKGVMKRYSLWLGHLALGDLLTRDKIPSSRISEDVLTGYVHWLEDKGNASTTVSSCIRDLNEALRVMEPGTNLSLIRELITTLHAREEPVRAKHTRIMHPDDILSGALAYLDNIPDRAFYDEISQACGYRDSLIIAFLACRPIRLGNVTAITLGQHLIQDGDRWLCQFEAHEMKDHLPLAFTFPDRLVPYLEIYHSRYRPILLKNKTSARLWISCRYTPMSEQAIYCSICRLTKEIFGRPINPHLFRDCAASALATDDPEHILAITRILGHSSIETTMHHYNQSQMTAAGEILCEVLADLRHIPEDNRHWSME